MINEWKSVLTDIIKDGKYVSRRCEKHADAEDAHEYSKCNNCKKDFQEILSYKFELENPRSRIATTESNIQNIFQLIGQFLWIYRGSFNTTEITYYAPSSDKFSSDGTRMIGAYGPRLFGIQHMNQIQHAIEILSEDRNKRKAVASVYLPQFDQHQLRDEVPCTLNLQYLVRDNKLNAITYMRSQNAFGLLPYDVFLFTMLQEYVQATLKPKIEVELGTYHHFSGSCHIYEQDKESACKILESNQQPCIMEPMPHDDIGLSLEKVNNLEVFLRTTVQSSFKVDFGQFLEKVDELCDEYWKQIGWILVYHGAKRIGDADVCTNILKRIDNTYQDLIKSYEISRTSRYRQN